MRLKLEFWYRMEPLHAFSNINSQIVVKKKKNAFTPYGTWSFLLCILTSFSYLHYPWWITQIIVLCWCRTLPAGYLEIGESAAEGAIRETWEEAHAEVEVVSPFAHLDIPLIGQVRERCLSFLILIFLWTCLRFWSFLLLLFGADLHNFLGKAEEAPLLTWSRVIGVPTFFARWYTFWFFGIFIDGGYFKVGKSLF